MDKVVLSYHDSCLYQSDLDILNSETDWLNDRIISFYFEYLQNEIYETDEILFLGSEVTQAIKLMENPDEVNAIILEPLNVHQKKFLILPLNDNSENKPGGSHWSLLVYSKCDNLFFNFDSASCHNYEVCSQLVKIIKGCLKIKGEKIQQVDCLQQNNSYDCGIYLICHTDLVCKTIMKSKSLKEIGKISYKSVLSKRSEIVEIIKNLRGST